MQLGMIGLGRMGASLVRRLTMDGHKCVVYDVSPAAVKKTAGRGIRGSASIGELVAKLAKPRAVWVMVPAGVTGKTIDELAACMEAGDIVIDGGNSYYRDDLARAKALKARGIHYVDCGTSGGVFGLARGYCLMIGGEDRVVRHLDPVFKSVAPGVEAAPRTPGKTGTPAPAEHGYLHCGPTAPATSSRWSTTASSTASWRRMPKGLNILRNADAGKGARYGRRDRTAAQSGVLPI